MTPIGVAWGHGLIEELEDTGATAIAHAPDEISGLL
jgi:hypothetical protein